MATERKAMADENAASHQHRWVIRPYDLQMVGAQLPTVLHVYCYGCDEQRHYERREVTT